MILTKPRNALFTHRHRMSRLLTILIAVLMLMLCMGVFVTTALASTGDDTTLPVGDTPTLIVNAAWLDGETIRIDVTDPQTGTRSAIAVPISDHLREGDNIEFISIQAVDPYGRQSGVIEIRNPFFNPNLPQSNVSDSTTGNSNDSQGNQQGENESAVELPNTDTLLRPLTPDGTGTVVDNVTDSDGGREFFTIFSEDGNEFFLIIDRHRNADNVYLLNAVTEEDLMSLARRNGREITNDTDSSVSAIPIPPQTTPDAGEDDSDNESPEPEPSDGRPTALSRIGNNLLIFGGIVVVVGGLAYYIKVVRPKKEGFSSNYDDEPDDYGYEDDDDNDSYDMDADESEDGDED